MKKDKIGNIPFWIDFTDIYNNKQHFYTYRTYDDKEVCQHYKTQAYTYLDIHGCMYVPYRFNWLFLAGGGTERSNMIGLIL